MQIDLKELVKDDKLEGGEHLDTVFLENYKKQHILDINPALIDRQ